MLFKVSFIICFVWQVGFSNNDSLFKLNNTRMYYESSLITKKQKNEISCYLNNALFKENYYRQVKKTKKRYYSDFISNLVIADAVDTIDLSDSELDVKKPVVKLNYLATNGKYTLISVSTKCKYLCVFYFLFLKNENGTEESYVIDEIPLSNVLDVKAINDLIFQKKVKMLVIKQNK